MFGRYFESVKSMMIRVGAIDELIMGRTTAAPFLTPFLISPYKNFTDVQLYSQIYPLWTYSYLLAMIPIFFLTDILRHKPIVVLEAMSYCISHVIILWGNKIWQMQLMEIIFGLSTASDIAYVSYMYAIVDQKYFKRITSYVRAATLFGKFLAYGSGQLLISTHLISFGSGCITLLMACLLPTISSKMIKNKNLQEVENCDQIIEINDDERVSLNSKSPTVVPGMKSYFQDARAHLMIFKNKTNAFKWYIWWALAGCGTFQVQNYVQTLWALLQQNGKAYNGITECTATLFGAIACFFVQYLKIDWAKRGELVLWINSIISAILLIIMSQTTSAFIAYILYIAFAIIYQLLMTAASVNIAAELTTESYGLVFGSITFAALFLQTILTVTVVDKHGLALDIRTQFFIYGCYFGAVSTIFIVMLIQKIISKVTDFNPTDQCPEKDALT
uniref:Reduced folate carrier n=1 Tax=Onchocerca volvulus TaxID=6282 RepID=A0A8R1XRN7_ONCVO